MAERKRRGWKAYVPTLRGGVQILVALVAIKLLLGMITPNLPTEVQSYAPSL